MILSSLVTPLFAQAETQGSATRSFYELRWFYLRNGSHTPRMMSLLKDHWAPAAKRMLGSVGFFQPTFGEQGPSVLMLSAFNSADAAAGAFDRMMQDADFASAYTKANSPEPAFVRMEATLLHAFSGTPAMHVPEPLPDGATRIFELRTYESNSMVSLRTKLDMFNGGESGIFQRLGMAPIFFGEAVFGRNLPQLTYMLSYESLAAREKLWKDFIADEEFTKLRTKAGYSDAEIVSTISNSILHPMAFSAIR